MLTLLTRRSRETRRSNGATAGAPDDVRRESVDAVLASVDAKERERADKGPAAAETESVAAAAGTAPTGLLLAAMPVPACDGAAPAFITLRNDRELLFMPTSGVAAEDDGAGVSNDETGELA